MRMSERVGWSEWLRKQDLHVLACVCVFVCVHACVWLEDSVALVRMLDCPFQRDIVTYYWTEDSASVPVFVTRELMCVAKCNCDQSSHFT